MKDTIGIDISIDWNRILHLFKVGLFGSVLVLIGDMLLGYGVADESLTGLQGMLSAYVSLSDTRLFWSAFLGLIGIPMEGLCYFAIYRLIAPYSLKHAHAYRAGILGYLIFGACGVHVPCLMACFVYKTLYAINPTAALNQSVQFALYFMVPPFIFFFISFWVIVIVQFHAFYKQKTPYPKWCCIFSLALILVVELITELLPTCALVNALAAAWISIANLWMFGGLLVMGKKVAGSCISHS